MLQLYSFRLLFGLLGLLVFYGHCVLSLDPRGADGKVPTSSAAALSISVPSTINDGQNIDKASPPESPSQKSSVSSSTSTSGTPTQWLVFASSDPAAILDARGDSIQWDYVDTQQKVALALMSESTQKKIAQEDHSLKFVVDKSAQLNAEGGAVDIMPSSALQSPSEIPVPAVRRYLESVENDTSTNLTMHEARMEKRDIIAQPGKAGEEMSFISQAPETSIFEIKDYLYDDRAGVGITVYVIDTGANTKHPEWTGMATPGRWLWPKKTLWTTIFGGRGYETDWLGHGSCVAAKVAGPTYGVAKKASVVMVKAGILTLAFSSYMLKATALIIQDVKSKGLQGKAVVNVSWGWPIKGSNQMSDETRDKWLEMIEELLDLDVVFVTAAGNFNEWKFAQPHLGLNSYPQVFTKKRPEIMVVGATDITGYAAPWTQMDDNVAVSAPGMVYGVGSRRGLPCPSGDDTGTDYVEGTSFSAPTVAGLAAYFMSISSDLSPDDPENKGKIAMKVKEKIQNMAYRRSIRREKGPLAIWNGQRSPPRITPSASSAQPKATTTVDSCKCHWALLLDTFTIRGRDFDTAKFSTDGESLRKQVAGCGGLTDWHFSYTNEDPRFDWVATGRLAVGDKACLGRAVVSAGGEDVDGCHGAG